MNSRAIFVLSVPRCGSSAVAGAMHRMGVEMGAGHLQGADASNEGGYYEDRRWQRINKDLAGYRYQTRTVWTLPDAQREQYRALAAKCARAEVWGAKGPRFAFTFHLVWPIVAEIAEVWVVLVQRKRAEVLASLVRHSQVAYGGSLRMAPHEADKLLRRWEQALSHSVDSFDGPLHAVDYGELMGPGQEDILRDLEQFCFRGSGRLSEGIREAVKWLDPSLRHHCP